MKKILILISFIFLSAYEINTKANQWVLAGSLDNIDVKNLNLDDKDVICKYNQNWSCYVKNYSLKNIKQLNTLNTGDGFWIFTHNDKSFNFNEKEFNYKFQNGWNLIAIKNDISPTQLGDNIDLIFMYKNNKWYYYSKDKNLPYEKIETLKKGDGVWVYYLKKGEIFIGNEKYPLINGEFNVTKSSNLDIEDIWNIGFEIDTSKNIDNFALGIKVIKLSTGAKGEVVIGGMSIKNGKITNPTYIVIYGEKSNGDSAGNEYDKNNNPQDILSKVVSLNGNILTLKFGTLLKYQTLVSSDKFKQKATFDVSITSDKLKIKNSKTISLGNITYKNVGDMFNNKNGIEGRITIK